MEDTLLIIQHGPLWGLKDCGNQHIVLHQASCMPSQQSSQQSWLVCPHSRADLSVAL